MFDWGFTLDHHFDSFIDLDHNGINDHAQSFIDLDHNGINDHAQSFIDLDHNGINDHAQSFIDLDHNGINDGSQSFIDLDHDGISDGLANHPILGSVFDHDAAATDLGSLGNIIRGMTFADPFNGTLHGAGGLLG